MSIKEIVVGTVVTLVIGGTAYTVNQTDVINNFADDTGLTQQQAEEYVKQVDEDDLVPYDKLGADFVDDGQYVLDAVEQMDCVNYQYEWETATLTCEAGKLQMAKLGHDEISLGNAYITLASDSATTSDIATTVGFIDDVNADFNLEIVVKLLDPALIDEAKKSNSYNKATLQAALKSN